MAKIAWLDQRCIFHPDVFAALTQHSSHDWANYRKTLAMETTLRAIYVRAGHNNLPFSSAVTAPEYQDNWQETYQDITDQRCVELRQRLADRPWSVAWSGGIDSTTVMASILRNVPRSEWSDITVLMNSMSIYENPAFYQEVIQPYFRVKMVSDLDCEQPAWIINGHPNDQLFEGAFQPFALRYRSWGHKHIYHDPDPLLHGLTELVDGSWATWFYEIMQQNISSTGLPIHTYSQFWWWWFFNHMWSSVTHTAPNHVAWFDSPDYQQWSLHHNLDQPRQGDHSTYKQAAKAYIAEVWPHSHYPMYKTKYHSGSLAASLRSHPVLNHTAARIRAVLDDGCELSDEINHDTLDLILDHVVHKR